MTKGRKTTYEERIEIVSCYIENGKDFAQTIEKYGAEGLIDKRGKHKDISKMTEVERLQAENRLLKAEIKQKELENAVLK